MQMSTTKLRVHAIAPLAFPKDVRDEQIAGTSQKGPLELGAELPRIRLDSKSSIDLSDLRSIERGLTSSGEVFCARN
jgi:hypothetical protein